MDKNEKFYFAEVEALPMTSTSINLSNMAAFRYK